jgi:hypothetical protein
VEQAVPEAAETLDRPRHRAALFPVIRRCLDERDIRGQQNFFQDACAPFSAAVFSTCFMRKIIQVYNQMTTGMTIPEKTETLQPGAGTRTAC